MPKSAPQKGSPQGSGDKKRSRGAGCIVLIVFVVLALLWKCIPDSHPVWQGTVPPAPKTTSTTMPAPPTDLPRRPVMVPTYDMEYLRWAGTLQPGQFATWGGIALPANPEVPVGGSSAPQPPCTMYVNVKVLAGGAIPFVIFDEPNYRRWRAGNNASAKAMESLSPEKDYALPVAAVAQFLVLDNRKGTAEVTVGLTGIQSCMRPLLPGEPAFQMQPRPTATWRLREEKLTLFGYLLRLLGGTEEAQVMTPPEIH